MSKRIHAKTLEVLAAGGNKSPISKAIDAYLNARGWGERSFDTAVVVDGNARGTRVGLATDGVLHATIQSRKMFVVRLRPRCTYVPSTGVMGRPSGQTVSLSGPRPPPSSPLPHEQGSSCTLLSACRTVR